MNRVVVDDDVFEPHLENSRQKLDPSPTGYRDYTPPAELIRNRYYQHTSSSSPNYRHDGNLSTDLSSAYSDPRKEYETFTHKTILLGDSGVGKTSLLVQFDTGEFQTGNFAATVGIGFTQENMSVTEEEPATGGYERRLTASLRGSRTRSSLTTNDSRVTELLVSHRHSFHETPDSSQPQQQTKPPCDYYFKVMLLGDSGVGKTCLLTRFRHGRFLRGNYITTVGIDFRNKIVTVDNTRVKLQIWDTAGQERFRSITHAYYRDAHALLLLYDVTNKTSYDNIRAWLCEIREYAHDDVVIILLGNKCDCGNERTVRKGDGERLAREHNVPFMETSAKTGLNVELAFFAVARHLMARKSENSDKAKFNVQDYVRQQSQTNTCFISNCSTT